MIEFPIVMTLFLLLLAFPALDLLFLGMAYNSGSVLNDEQVRQAALISHTAATSPLGKVKQTIPNNWRQSGLGRFANVNGAINTELTYRNGSTDANGLVEKIVRVVTSFDVNPFLVIPFPVQVPGLNAPVAFRFASERQMEDPTDAPPSSPAP